MNFLDRFSENTGISESTKMCEVRGTRRAWGWTDRYGEDNSHF